MFVQQNYFDLYPPDKAADLDDVAPTHRKWLRRKWPQWVVDNDEWKPAVRGYLASISFADAQVDRLLDALDASPYTANTIIAYLRAVNGSDLMRRIWLYSLGGGGWW